MSQRYSAFGKPLWLYNRCWTWCPRASTQTWISLIFFGNTFCRSAFEKSLCTYKRCWTWCSRASVQAWTRLISLTNTFYRSVFGKSLCTYKRCWKRSPRASILTIKSTYRSLSAQRRSERTLLILLLKWLSADLVEKELLLIQARRQSLQK
jgi:hypothetical protein